MSTMMTTKKSKNKNKNKVVLAGNSKQLVRELKRHTDNKQLVESLGSLYESALPKLSAALELHLKRSAPDRAPSEQQALRKGERRLPFPFSFFPNKLRIWNNSTALYEAGLNQRRRNQLWKSIRTEDAQWRAQEREAILQEQALLREQRAASTRREGDRVRRGADVRRQDIATARLKGREDQNYRRRVIRSLERSAAGLEREPRPFDALQPCAFSHSERFLGVELAKLSLEREKERVKRQARQEL